MPFTPTPSFDTMLKVATWNVNSIRSRLDRVLAWLQKETPSVVCLQELKCEADAFPFDVLRDAGYHAAVYGQKTYNGVAILSRTEPEAVLAGWGAAPEDEQARLVAARVGGVRVVSAYVPNGAVVGSDKWVYKLDWLARLPAYLTRTTAAGEPVLLCGDFNVAPDERDVARPEVWRASVLFHDDARRALTGVVGWGLHDVVRQHHEGPGPYSWWDYRNLAFPKNDGLRIDHIFATPALAGRCTEAYVDRDERKGDKPSDHAPVVAVFDV